jgi:hypothetical protein
LARENMNKHELREWLSIAPADIPVWGAAVAVGVMYFVENSTVDIVLSVLVIGLTTFSCLIGMKHDDRVSKFANLAKKIFYPVSVLLGLVAIYLNFTQWNFHK